jgi:hypothetical protein
MPKIAYLLQGTFNKIFGAFNTCFSNFTEGCTNPNIHFLHVLTNVGQFSYFTGNQRFSGFAIFNIKENRLVWSGSIQYFQQTKPTNFRAGLNFLDQQFQVQWFFDPYNNLHFGVSGSPVSAFE